MFNCDSLISYIISYNTAKVTEIKNNFTKNGHSYNAKKVFGCLDKRSTVPRLLYRNSTVCVWSHKTSPFCKPSFINHPAWSTACNT